MSGFQMAKLEVTVEGPAIQFVGDDRGAEGEREPAGVAKVIVDNFDRILRDYFLGQRINLDLRHGAIGFRELLHRQIDQRGADLIPQLLRIDQDVEVAIKGPSQNANPCLP